MQTVKPGWKKLRSITFLAVNDEVSLLIACCYGVDYTIAIWVFGQDRGDEGVGARVLGNKGSIPAREELKFSRRKEVRRQTHTWKSDVCIIYTFRSISGLIGRMVVSLACLYDLTCPLSRQDQRQMIMSAVGCWSHWTNGASKHPAHCGPFDPEPFKMSPVICSLCGAGQQDAHRDTGDWYTTIAQVTTGWRWTAWLGGSAEMKRNGEPCERRESAEGSRWQKGRLALKWQVKWYVGVEDRGAGYQGGGGPALAEFEVDSSAELIPCEISWCALL